MPKGGQKSCPGCGKIAQQGEKFSQATNYSWGMVVNKGH